MRFIDSIEKGKFGGLGVPDRVIETLISKLFFFGDTVYKVYKHNKAFFGDFSDDRFRHEFYHNDFTWNSTMAPSIYLKLGYVKEAGGSFVEASHDESEDYFILMKRIDDSRTLFNLSKKGVVSKEDLRQITSEMFARIEKLTEIKRTDMQDLFDRQYSDLDLENLETTREWLYMAPTLISKQEADSIIDALKSFVSSSAYFATFDRSKYLASIDNHGGNILFEGGKVNFIDSMPPMRLWRIQNGAYSVARPATDMEVLLGKDYSDAMFEEFERVRRTKIDSGIRSYLQAVAALIQAPYMYVLQETELAGKYWDFAKTKSRELSG